MTRTGNSMVDGVKVTHEWVDCRVCNGKGTIPKDPNNLDCEIEVECPDCLGARGGYEEVWR